MPSVIRFIAAALTGFEFEEDAGYIDGGEYMDESERDSYPVAVEGYAFVDTGCTIIVPVITTEVEIAAIDRGCVPMEIPYIDEIRVCNKSTGQCDLVR